MPDNADPSLNGSHAGAYGFTRREIVALTIVIGICVALGLFARWRDRERDSRAVWVVQDVMVGNSESGAGSRESAAVDDSEGVAGVRANRPISDLIDLNTADVRELSRLPGIGQELAKRIVDERAVHGAFVNLIDLQRVRGIGPKKAAMLTGWVLFTKPVDDTTQHQ